MSFIKSVHKLSYFKILKSKHWRKDLTYPICHNLNLWNLKTHGLDKEINFENSREKSCKIFRNSSKHLLYIAINFNNSGSYQKACATESDVLKASPTRFKMMCIPSQMLNLVLMTDVRIISQTTGVSFNKKVTSEAISMLRRVRSHHASRISFFCCGCQPKMVGFVSVNFD